ncbi:hypothetical protein [Acidisphaera sp. L21]|uniref:hypothetical protein n=1 Tax=Acidisphaera sp. L21 TaxID=1641851 RepID=UPI00131BB10E|nr:hypothetical protein [Acidisphaera sp. L21]
MTIAFDPSDPAHTAQRRQAARAARQNSNVAEPAVESREFTRGATRQDCQRDE